MVINWLKKYIHTPNSLDDICEALLNIDIDARCAGSAIEIRGSPIARVRIEDESSYPGFPR